MEITKVAEFFSKSFLIARNLKEAYAIFFLGKIVSETTDYFIEQKKSFGQIKGKSAKIHKKCRFGLQDTKRCKKYEVICKFSTYF